jgi:outer membrane lipoprotein SlyB
MAKRAPQHMMAKPSGIARFRQRPSRRQTDQVATTEVLDDEELVSGFASVSGLVTYPDSLARADALISDHVTESRRLASQGVAQGRNGATGPTTIAENLWLAAMRPSVGTVPLSGEGIKRTTFWPRLSPLGRLGALFVAMMVLVTGAVIMLSQTSATTKVYGPPHIRVASPNLIQPSSGGNLGQSAAGAVSAGGAAASGTAAGASAGGGAGSSGGLAASAASSAPAGQGLRPATASETSAVEETVLPDQGQTIKLVLISESEPNWGVVEFADVSGHIDNFALVSSTSVGGGWVPVVDGYPNLPCFPSLPQDVRSDLGSLMTGC